MIFLIESDCRKKRYFVKCDAFAQLSKIVNDNLLMPFRTIICVKRFEFLTDWFLREYREKLVHECKYFYIGITKEEIDKLANN